MKKYVFFLLCTFWGYLGNAQIVNSLDSMRQQFEQDVARMRADFEAYEAQARADYDRYVQSVKSVWGGDTIVDNTKKVWVEYGNDYRSRSIVDFEKGGIDVEIAVDESEKQDTSLIDARLVAAVRRMLDSRGSTCPYPSSVDVSVPLTDKPILDGLVDFSSFDMTASSEVSGVLPKSKRPVPPKPTVKGKMLDTARRSEVRDVEKKVVKKETSEKTLAERRKESREKASRKKEALAVESDKSLIARKIVAQSKKKVTGVKGADGKSRRVVQIQMNLVSDNLSRNAALYKDLVAEFSNRFQIEQPLIYAIMEQESAFNPQAKSWVPAYGLMQLVPKSGGADAYRYVYHKDWIPTQSYLFNPRNNIELGTAYLRVLMNQFASVSDVHCRRLCVIAGYNTGAGNVSRAFIGTTNLGKAFSHIESFDYNGLYNHLIANLPHSETRDYVVKVTQRREKYLKE